MSKHETDQSQEKARVKCQVEQLVMPWMEFGKEALHGIFWVRGTHPEVDIDVDSDGRTVGFPTGEELEFVSLVEIDFEPGPDGEYEVSPANEYATGEFGDYYGITHYMPFLKPVFTEA